MGGVEGGVVEEEVAGEGFGIYEALVTITVSFFIWMCLRRVDRCGSKWRRTLRVELQNVDVAVCVRDGYVELFVRREEGGCYHFDCVGRFAEETELVWILL